MGADVWCSLYRLTSVYVYRSSSAVRVRRAMPLAITLVRAPALSYSLPLLRAPFFFFCFSFFFSLYFFCVGRSLVIDTPAAHWYRGAVYGGYGV